VNCCPITHIANDYPDGEIDQLLFQTHTAVSALRYFA
jgi:hypothetical protein